VLSQVVLSLQLPFAVIPLVHFVSDRRRMGEFAIGPWVRAGAWLVALVIVGLNAKLVADTLADWIRAAGPRGIRVELLLLPVLAGIGALLLWITLQPWLARWATWNSGPAPSCCGGRRPRG